MKYQAGLASLTHFRFSNLSKRRVKLVLNIYYQLVNVLGEMV
jgi:hypothetical protein